MKIRFDTPPVSAQQSNGLAVRYAAAKREVPRWRWYLMLALIGGPLLFFVWRLLVAVWWETAPGFVIVPTLSVKASGSGTVRSIATVGTAVERGTVLVVLAPPAVDRAASAAPEVPRPGSGIGSGTGTGTGNGNGNGNGNGKAALNFSPGDDGSIAVLDDALALAQRTLAFRRERLAAIESLKRDGAATQPEADAARSAVAQAEGDVLHARGDLLARRTQLAEQARAQLRGALVPAVSAAQAAPAPSVLSAAAPASGAGAANGGVIVRSPFAGTVTASLVVPGEFVTPATEMLLLQGNDAPFVEAYVSPADTKFARVGRHATLRFFDGGRVGAVVSEVAAQTSRIPAERVGPLSPRTQAIVVRLRPEGPLPAHYRINVLPLDVRFDTVWPWRD